MGPRTGRELWLGEDRRWDHSGSLVRLSPLSLQEICFYFAFSDIGGGRKMNKTIFLNLTHHPEDGDRLFKWWVEGVLLTAVSLPGIFGNLIT